MRWLPVIALVTSSVLVSCGGEVTLDGSSMFALYESTQAMKQKLELSTKDAAALDGAIDVLVGDATRRMVEAAEAAAEPRPAVAQTAVEAEVLAPIDGLTFREVVTGAADKVNRELEGLLAELSEYEAIAEEHSRHLARVTVVRSGYGMSLATRRSWIDLTVHNGTDQTLSELLFDCRLIEEGSETREQGTCAAAFPSGLAPGATGIAQSYVGWESEPRPTRKVDARPIRAFGAQRNVLWQVPSELDPREAGAIGDIKNRVAVVDGSLRRLKTVELPAE
jgi:hypothetical protein